MSGTLSGRGAGTGGRRGGGPSGGGGAGARRGLVSPLARVLTSAAGRREPLSASISCGMLVQPAWRRGELWSMRSVTVGVFGLGFGDPCRYRVPSGSSRSESTPDRMLAYERRVPKIAERGPIVWQEFFRAGAQIVRSVAQVIRRNATPGCPWRARFAPTRAELSVTYRRRCHRPLHSYQARARCPAPDLAFRYRRAGVRACGPCNFAVHSPRHGTRCGARLERPSS